MYRKLILAAAMTAAFSAPAFADWNVIKAVPGSSGGSTSCMTVERDAAATGETKVGGPFATEAEAKTAMEMTPGCENRNDDSSKKSEPSGNTPN